MDSKERISIVIVSDNAFMVMLATLIKSIEVNHKSDEIIDFYIVEDHVTKRNREKLLSSVSSPFINFTFYKMNDILPVGRSMLVDKSSFPLNVYVRFFVPDFIPQHISRILYLDADMVVNVDISELWNINIGEYVIGAAIDRAKVVSSTWAGIPNYKELGLHPDTKYFNAGLQIINAFKWRSENITERLMKCKLDNEAFLKFNDQYCLNVVFANNWYELSSKWNCFPDSTEPNPYLIHFIGDKPIYKTYTFNEDYKDRFYYYLSMTGWRGFKPLSGNMLRINKLINKIRKKLV